MASPVLSCSQRCHVATAVFTVFSPLLCVVSTGTLTVFGSCHREGGTQVDLVSGGMSRQVDIGTVIFMISFSIILSGGVLIFDRRVQARTVAHHGTLPLLAAHGCFLLAAVSLELGKHVELWLSASLVTLSALSGIFLGYVGMLANVTRSRPRWDVAAYAIVIGVTELVVALSFARLAAVLIVTSLVSGTICIGFAASIWRRSRHLGVMTRGFTAPFVLIAAAYLVRPIIALSGDPLLIATSSIGIALSFSLATFFWVFGSMSLRSFLLARDLEYAVSHDSLTDLENRFSFEAFRKRLPKVERRIARQPFACIFIDLDFFKAVNDTYGHEAGDVVLQETARRLKMSCPAGDRIFRMGGDEFVIWHAGATPEGLARLLSDLLTTLCQPIRYGIVDLKVGASLGAHLSQTDESPRDVIHKADLALYASKRSGRSCFMVYTPTLETVQKVA